MNKIITPQEIQNLKDIGSKIDIQKINPIIEQVQLTELKDLLGTTFFFDVLNNLDNPEYQDLLTGSSFTYLGVDQYQDGLKALTADYFMSKYVMTINTNFTPFGATIKVTNDSTPADRNSLKDISTQQLQLAGSRWEVIRNYLTINQTRYPKWLINNNLLEGNSSERIFRIRKI